MNTSTRRTLPILLGIVAAVPAAAAPGPDSAYVTDPQTSHVEDATSRGIGEVNMIACIMAAMRPDALVNEPSYIALIDKSNKVLDGNVKEIRRRFATNTYRIEYKGTHVAFANALGWIGEITDVKEGPEFSNARVKLNKGSTLNDALRQVITSVEIHGVEEEVPRMHDVFIRTVGVRDRRMSGITEGITE